jgi:diguanylate cyclase (GGDEF)-like protein
VTDAERGRGVADHLTVEVLMADVDHLKRVNDTFGHDAGDDLLQVFAAVLRDAAPVDAVVARIGGDEFGILRIGPGRALDELALRVRSALPDRAIACGAPVSASFGVAGCPPESSVTDAVHRADTRLVADKQHRRAAR